MIICPATDSASLLPERSTMSPRFAGSTTWTRPAAPLAAALAAYSWVLMPCSWTRRAPKTESTIVIRIRAIRSRGYARARRRAAPGCRGGLRAGSTGRRRGLNDLLPSSAVVAGPDIPTLCGPRARGGGTGGCRVLGGTRALLGSPGRRGRGRLDPHDPRRQVQLDRLRCGALPDLHRVVGRGDHRDPADPAGAQLDEGRVGRDHHAERARRRGQVLRVLQRLLI